MHKYSICEIIKVELAIFGFRVLSYLPMPLLYAFSYLLELIIYQLAKYKIMPSMRKRYAIALINLELCFPNYSDAKRRQIWRQSFRESILSYLNYGLLFSASVNKLLATIECQGMVKFFENYTKVPIIVMVPHFCAFDLALNRVSQEVVFCSTYKPVDNYFFEKLRQSRLRFVRPGEESVIFSVHSGLTPVVRAMSKKKLPFFYLPDLDYGETNSIYVPFLGYQARSTLNIVPRLANLTGAKVYSCSIYRKQNKYIFEFSDFLDNYPTNNLANDVKQMNFMLESSIQQYPEYYRWYYPLFKTQPGLADNYLYVSNIDKVLF